MELRHARAGHARAETGVIRMPEPGNIAPDFTLSSTIGEINLQQRFSGKKLVLAFYIEDKTPG